MIPFVFFSLPVVANGSSEEIENQDRNRTALVFATNPTGNFNASGMLASLIVDDDLDPEYIISGRWNLVAENGNTSSFRADFTMVSTNGTDRHTHTLTNFVPNAVVPLILDEQGTTVTGMVDVRTNGTGEWYAVQVTITIAKNNAIKIIVAPEQVNNHFRGQPIYGIVDSIKNVE